MPNTPEIYLNPERVAELWAAVQVALGKKVDKTAMSGYTTPDAVARAITTALTDYATTESAKAAIAAALTNYMTTSEVNAAIASAVANAAHVQFEAVDELPESGESNVIYLVPSTEDETIKNQSMWINGKWVSLGSTKVNLSNYWSKTDLRAMTAEELQAILV